MSYKAICLVTGVAGFIGSHLAERLLTDGYRVIGLDCFTNYYARPIKRRNLERLLDQDGFHFLEGNILDLDLKALLTGDLPSPSKNGDPVGQVDYILHLAAQAGVRASWGASFNDYTSNNILATQRLLEAAKDIPASTFVYASSSSVYGDAERLPITEDSPLHPVSPYGVAKLAAENLCYLYWRNHNVPTVSLRYFTVYGPRQRPDMAFHKFIKAVQEESEITIYGSGEQTRDYSYIADIVEGTVQAMKSNARGQVFNFGGGAPVTVNEVVADIEGILGKNAKVRMIEPQKGDVKHTWADSSRAAKILGYAPKTTLLEGLKAQAKWILDAQPSSRRAH